VLTSIGLGDITPANLGEYMVSIMLMATSSIFWAYTIGNFCSIISTMDMHTVTFRQRMDELNYMMEDLEIPKDVRRRCRAYFHNARRLKRVSYYHNLEQELSPTLRRETKAHFYIPVLENVWYFKISSKEFLLTIATVLTPKLYAPMEHLDMPMTLFINLRGIAAKRGHPMGKGVVWGHDFLLEYEEIFDQCCASALTFVEVLTLQRSQIEEVLPEFEDELQVMQRARNYYLLRNKLQAWAANILTERNTLEKATTKLAFGMKKTKSRKTILPGRTQMPGGASPLGRRGSASLSIDVTPSLSPSPSPSIQVDSAALWGSVSGVKQVPKEEKAAASAEDVAPVVAAYEEKKEEVSPSKRRAVQLGSASGSTDLPQAGSMLNGLDEESDEDEGHDLVGQASALVPTEQKQGLAFLDGLAATLVDQHNEETDLVDQAAALVYEA
jgi:hypothetical protein